MNIAKNTQVGYFAFTKDMTVCMDDFHVASGLLDECPNCESDNVEHLSRVTGYIQAVSGWNEGRSRSSRTGRDMGGRVMEMKGSFIFANKAGNSWLWKARRENG